jgi:very-short-patch-repair endonuclease
LIVSGRPDARIAAVASRQRGRISRRQLREAGVPADAVRRRVDAGILLAVNDRVLAVGHLGATPLAAETGALLAARDGAVLSHLSAAALWGLLRWPRQIHLLIAGTAIPVRAQGVIAHRTRNLEPVELRFRHGLPVTSPARALLDTSGAELVPARVLERAVETAVVSGVMRVDELDSALQRGCGRSGSPLLREILDSASSGITRSEAEDRMVAIVRDADLSPPLVNSHVRGYEVDLCWPEAALVVEIDGYRFHSSRAAFERDRLRDARLQAAGYLVMRVTWRQITREPLAVIARLASTLVRRQAASLPR